MTAKKLVTILTPLYNKAPFLKTYVEGLAKQTFRDKMRVLVVDDGSTDNSVEILKSYAGDLPIDILSNETNMGLVYTTLRLYRNLDTKYWAVLDPDDYYISPDKISKAVNFLESHDEYSCYACNNLSVFANGRNFPCFPIDRPSQTYSGMKGSPFFQTASTTFRNNFTTDFLNLIEKITVGTRRHAFESDGFRNFVAHHFGKFYFDSSIDSAWRRDVGIWGTASTVEQDLSNMKSHYEYFKFSKEYWSVDENALHCLRLSYYFYSKVLEEFVDSMKRLDVENYANPDEIARRLLEQCRKFSDLGVKVSI